MRDEDRQYFERLESRLDEAFDVAEAAKEHSGDPQPEVEIPVAKDMADRVENILGIENVAERVRELEGQMSREEAPWNWQRTSRTGTSVITKPVPERSRVRFGLPSRC
nr:hypothetical protein [Haladaptatus sp. R4]